MKKILIPGVLAGLLLGVSTMALAKLPPPSDEARAKAAEAAAKAAWSGKVAAYQLCKVQDKVTADYLASAKAAGKETGSATPGPACADPGAFSDAPAAVVKPLEGAGAHSPAETATSPPSGKQPDAAVNPANKS
ncbi:MAG: hypothetical protein ABI135_10040 [Rhodoferax sp.]